MSTIRRRGKRTGFTLIELLLVLVILAVLTTIVVVNMGSVSKQSNETKAKSDIAHLEQAVKMYQIQVGDYPPSLDALVTNPGNPAWKGPYVERGLPVDPWQHSYNYAYPGSHNTSGFDLWSTGDGKTNAEGLDNWTPAKTAH